ncbi:PREDICTED: leukocyte receptor cluster member 1 isoform X2 [Galeopterus variegatus]|uniref:Leukocyte receptor cluster member 1 isoform X2 n=1 Tax=Galeopterus variegatus TaxID=482537 RepID=A0ABM0S9V0_GALVR|nr:PREDICTED: leukocyte receptor cluster member 1 isoform X2 [Galeopterus variegatus]
MNILPKKSWHVRNKDNVARVRRDEAQAREEEKERERRVLLAQQEARTEFLRKKARHQNLLPELEAADVGAPSSGPVDLFQELLEEGKGVTRGNKEYEEEKRQEKERQEKALGILTYLGQSAAEAQTQPPWYQLPPGQGGTPPGPGPDEKIKNRLDPLREIQKHLGKRKHSSDKDPHPWTSFELNVFGGKQLRGLGQRPCWPGSKAGHHRKVSQKRKKQMIGDGGTTPSSIPSWPGARVDRTPTLLTDF